MIRWATTRAEITPLESQHLATLYEWETDASVHETWRLRGATPEFGAWVNDLWHAMADQRVIVRPDSQEMIGLCQLYNLDLRLQHGWFSILSSPEVRGTGLAFEGCGLFLERCFTAWPLRRIYFLTIEDNFEAFASLTRRNTYSVYGRLRERVLVGDSWRDVIVGGINRTDWESGHGAIMRRAINRSPSNQPR
jgi:RimJ/RimL family protein N-acetyltransferase